MRIVSDGLAHGCSALTLRMTHRKGPGIESVSHSRSEVTSFHRPCRFNNCIAILVPALATIFIINWRNSHVERVTATGVVLETRIDAVGTGNSVQGGYIYYQLEARVQYSSQRGNQVHWMPASEVATSRELLAARLASHPKSCYVAWEARHPESPHCEFLPISSLP
jgi:hypothetical protein